MPGAGYQLSDAGCPAGEMPMADEIDAEIDGMNFHGSVYARLPTARILLPISLTNVY